MAVRSIHQKTERTPEELAELKATRERFQRERPGLDDLVDSGRYDGPFRQGDVSALREVLASLRDERNRQGLSLDDVSARSGMDKAALSRLETGKALNPTVGTLWRYAQALGMKITIAAEPAATVHS